MSTDIEHVIVRSLRARAGADVNAAELAARTAARGRSRVLRQRVGIACAALLAVGGAVAVPSLVDRPSVGGGPMANGVPTLPSDVDAPPLTQRPELVGTDPALMHFTADALTGVARGARWTSGTGFERLAVTTADDNDIWIELGRDKAALEGLPRRTSDLLLDGDSSSSNVLVGDRPGVLERATGARLATPVWVLTWQPVDGVWARAEVPAPTDESILAAAEAVRVDEVRRCAAPFQLTALPAGARVLACEVNLAGEPDQPFVDASLAVGTDPSRVVHVRAEAGGIGGLTISTTRTGYAEADARLVLGGVRVSETPQDLNTWPTTLVAG